MREYGKIFTEFWTSPKLQSLSDHAKLLAIYLISCEHSNLIGCFRLPKEYIASDLRWPVETVAQGLAELIATGYATYDEAVSWVLINDFLKWNPLDHPNWVKAAKKLIGKIPANSPISQHFIEIFESNCETHPKPIPNQSISDAYSGTGTGTVAVAVGKEDDALNSPHRLGQRSNSPAKYYSP